jgi:hypothetical protein
MTLGRGHQRQHYYSVLSIPVNNRYIVCIFPMTGHISFRLLVAYIEVINSSSV